MTELQNTEAENAEVITSASDGEVQTTNESSESAPETQAEDNSNVRNRINKITAEKWAYARENEELKKKLESQTSQTPSQPVEPTGRPVLPDDIYDEEAMRKYHENMATYAEDQAAKVAQKTYADQQQGQARAKQEQENAVILQNYAQAGLASGLTVEQMQVNEQTIVNAGIKPELGQYIMADDSGAKIVDYLVSNPDEMAQVLSASPMQAAVMIETQIKPKASGPGNITKAADPVESVSGSGSLPALDPFEAGGGKFL